MTPTTMATTTTIAGPRPSRTRRGVRAGLATLGASLALSGAGVVLAGSASAADTGIPVLEAIKQCESGGSYTAQNPTSTASGAYQFLDTTWQSMDAAAGYARAADAPEAVQDAAAVELYTEQGTTPWLASASCWQGQGYAVTTGAGAASASAGSTAATTTSGSSATGSSATGSSAAESTASESSASTTATGSDAAPADTAQGPGSQRPAPAGRGLHEGRRPGDQPQAQAQPEQAHPRAAGQTAPGAAGGHAGGGVCPR